MFKGTFTVFHIKDYLLDRVTEVDQGDFYDYEELFESLIDGDFKDKDEVYTFIEKNKDSFKNIGHIVRIVPVVEKEIL